VSKELPQLEVRGDLTTSGGTGTSLVQGQQVQLSAIALSIKPGGRIDQATIGGRIATGGDDLVTVEIDGSLGSLEVAGGIHAEGRGSDAIHVRDDALDLPGIEVTAAGQAIVHQPIHSVPARQLATTGCRTRRRFGEARRRSVKAQQRRR
jgi:hypothetical protein